VIPIAPFFRRFHLYPVYAVRALEQATYAGEQPAVLETLKAIYHAVAILNEYSHYDAVMDVGGRSLPGVTDGFVSVYERDPFTPILKQLVGSQRMPEAWYRVQMILQLLSLLVERGAKVIPNRIMRVFWEVSEKDPDERVRAWALFAMNPHGKDVPEYPELSADGEGGKGV